MKTDFIGKYESFLDILEKLIFENISIKLATYKGFQDMLKSDFEKTVKNFPLLYFIVESLQVDCVMTISKLTENKKGDKTIQKFLNFTYSNFKNIQQKYDNLTRQKIEKNLAELDSVESQLIRIRTQRDKYYAHADNEYFFQQNKLLVDFPDTFNDLVDITKVLQGIINDHRYLIKGSKLVCISDIVYLNTYKTMELLSKASDEWYLKYRQEEHK